MIGTGTPRRWSASTIRGTAAAASSLFTVTLTSSLPASASAAACAMVASTSAVSVLVIAWTTMGCRLPRGTGPTNTVGVGRRRGGGMAGIYMTQRRKVGRSRALLSVFASLRLSDLHQPQRPSQALPGHGVERAVLLERGQRGEDLGSIPVDVAITQLADHSGETMLILVCVELAALPALCELPKLRGDPARGDRPARRRRV